MKVPVVPECVNESVVVEELVSVLVAGSVVVGVPRVPSDHAVAAVGHGGLVDAGLQGGPPRSSLGGRSEEDVKSQVTVTITVYLTM